MFLFLVLFAIGTGSATNVRPEDVLEPCLGNFVTQDFDENWISTVSNSTLYFPLVSKYSMLIMSKNFYQVQEFETITEAQMMSSCMSARELLGGNVTAYNGKSLTVLFTPTNVARLYRFQLAFPDAVTGGGYASIALSDSKSYGLLDFCFDNGFRSFLVASLKKSLDSNTRSVITAHVKSLGFKEKNFLTLNYDKCSEKGGVLTTSGTDLPKPSPPKTLFIYRPGAVYTKKYLLPSYILKA